MRLLQGALHRVLRPNHPVQRLEPQVQVGAHQPKIKELPQSPIDHPSDRPVEPLLPLLHLRIPLQRDPA
jgi:hypothetical protein